MSVVSSPKARGQHGDVDQQIVDLLLAMMDTFKEHFVAALEAFDLPTSQGHLLMCLQEPRAMSELARSMGFDASHITLIVDRLEERGLVERRPDDHDRRVKRIAITGQGAVVREEIRARLFDTLPPLSQLTDGQRLQLRDLLAMAVGVVPAGPEAGAGLQRSAGR